MLVALVQVPGHVPHRVPAHVPHRAPGHVRHRAPGHVPHRAPGHGPHPERAHGQAKGISGISSTCRPAVRGPVQPIQVVVPPRAVALPLTFCKTVRQLLVRNQHAQALSVRLPGSAPHALRLVNGLVSRIVPMREIALRMHKIVGVASVTTGLVVSTTAKSGKGIVSNGEIRFVATWSGTRCDAISGRIILIGAAGLGPGRTVGRPGRR